MVAWLVSVDDAVDDISILANDIERAVGRDGGNLSTGGRRRIVEMGIDNNTAP